MGVNGLGIADEVPGPDFPADKPPKLTVAMVARLQGFPGDWTITGRKTAAYRQVGNAFPPPVARALGTAIAAALNAAPPAWPRGIARSLRSPECFGTIFHRHAPAIYRYISRRLGPDSAEDLVAETFLGRSGAVGVTTAPTRMRGPGAYAILFGQGASIGYVIGEHQVVPLNTVTDTTLRPIKVPLVMDWRRPRDADLAHIPVRGRSGAAHDGGSARPQTREPGLARTAWTASVRWASSLGAPALAVVYLLSALGCCLLRGRERGGLR